ncbi:MAG: hypothetical protein B6245_17050 [Desulfobacteraceae bacterium 4572_88]|nr:MAG: hypothetical protein B6245_17050 [Desulfobacteraceae bacterium 4572_88]
MSNEISTHRLAHEIRDVYDSDPLQADIMIEDKLRQRFDELPSGKKLEQLTDMIREFAKVNPDSENLEDIVFSRLCSLMLGVPEEYLSSSEHSQRLAESLNTIFDKLNELVSIINMSFYNKNTDKTIRHIINFNLKGDGHSQQSLESYLEQIKKAFLITREAFKIAIEAKLNELFSDLAPDNIGEEAGGMFFGRKAKLFEIYDKRFGIHKRRFDSGRFMDELSAEFEKNCQKLFMEKETEK